MSKTYSAGIVTAYGAAKRAGYQGTYEDFCRQQAGYAENAAAVEQAKTDAINAKNDAVTAKNTAVSAKDDAVSAKDTAVAKASEASTKAQEAGQSATNAGLSATSASQSAQNAEQSAQSVSGSLAQIATNTADISQLKADLGDFDADIFGNNRIKNGSFKVRNIGSSSSPNFIFSSGSFKIRRASAVVGNGATIYFPVSEGVEIKNYTCVLNVSGGNDASVYVTGYAQEPDEYNESSDKVYGVYSDVTSINDTIEFTIGDNISYVGIYIGVRTNQIDYVIGTLFFALSDEVGAIQKIKNDIAQGIDEATTNINTSLFGFEFITPPVVNICGGIEQNIYWQNVIKGFNTKKSYCIETSAKTENCEYFGRLSPSENTSLANQGFKIYFYPYNSEYVISSDTVSYNVVPKSSGAGLTKKILLIGDSLTFNAPLSRHLVDDLLTNDAMNVSLIGTLGSAPYLREGRSGWSPSDYVTGYEHGDSFTNAFWNPTSQAFDFSYYMTQNGFTGVDYVFINLGTNLGGHTVTEMVEALEEMVTSIHAYDANIRVGVWTPPPRALMGNGFLRDNDNTLSRVKAIINQFKNRTGSRIYVVPVTLNVDPYHDFPYETVNVSSRNSSFQMVVATDRTHPADAGYYKMADVIYNYIKYFGSLDA